MSTDCSHTFSSGQNCHAPALEGSSLCRHHDPRKRAEAAQRDDLGTFDLPEFHDAHGVLLALNAVLQAMSKRKIKRSEAATFLYGLQLATRIVRELKQAAGDQQAAAFSPEPAPPALDESLERILEVSCESGLDEAAKLWVQEAREPGDNSPISEDDLEDARQAIIILQQTGDPSLIFAAMDARIEEYEKKLQAASAARS